MSGHFPFEYAILRYHHDLVTGEFLNVGLVMFSYPARFFRAKLLPRYRRITRTFPGADGDFYRRYVGHLQSKMDHMSDQLASDQISMFGESSGKLATLLERALVRDSASIRFAEIRGGRSSDLEDTFDSLYMRLVEQYLQEGERESRSDDEVWDSYRPHFQKHHLLGKLQRHVVETNLDRFEFEHAWKNGKWNVLQPVSFDLVRPGNIVNKAKTWLGSAHILSKVKDLSEVYLLLGGPQSGKVHLAKAYLKAKKILLERVDGFQLRIVEEEDVEGFVEEVKSSVSGNPI